MKGRGQAGKINLASADINVGLGTTMKIKEGGGPRITQGKSLRKIQNKGNLQLHLKK